MRAQTYLYSSLCRPTWNLLGIHSPTIITIAMLVLATLLLSGSALAAPEVKLGAGTVKGSTCSSGVSRFLGIPYAESTGGSNRFMPPKPFNGTLGKNGAAFDATKTAAPCIQFSDQFGESAPAASEDWYGCKPPCNCMNTPAPANSRSLTVDVYAPASAKEGSNLPVKVWAYGGSNEGGATSDKLYDACTLASDAIVVELNYRLGPMGFLALGDAGIAGNMAIQDYLAALEWVQTNVGSFGGDKDRVVLFGQSAGADDVFTVSTLPQAPKLMSAAIMESGGGAFVLSKQDGEDAGASFADALKCPKGTDQLSCLQKASIDDIQKVYQNVPILQNSTRPGQFSSDNFAISVPNTLRISSAILDGKVIAKEPLAAGSKVPLAHGRRYV